MIESPIFTPCQIGPITLRNRTIRSAAFENMAVKNAPSEALFNYHTAVARGGIGMTTVAYASVSRSGLSFEGQLWLREEIIPELKKLTDAIHAEGAKASIQIGHCGNMTHRATCGEKPLSPSGRFNLYSPTFTRKMTRLWRISEMPSISAVAPASTVSKCTPATDTLSASSCRPTPTVAKTNTAALSKTACVLCAV